MGVAEPAGAGSPAATGAGLPAPVAEALHHAVGDVPAPGAVEITQEGRMWSRPGARAMRFTATQVLAADRIGFSWRARFAVAGPIALRVVDEYRGGRGGLEVRLLGMPVQRRSGPAVDLGEALRYLAEIAWVPFAIAANPTLGWRAAHRSAAVVSAHVGGTLAEVLTEFGPGGDITRVSCEDRPRDTREGPVPTRWSGEFHDHREMGGIRVPTRAEVRWDLEHGPFTYWEGTVTALRLLPADGRTREGG